MNDANIFLGTSVANSVDPEFFMNMKKDPLILALANPVPDVNIEKLFKLRSDGFIFYYLPLM